MQSEGEKLYQSIDNNFSVHFRSMKCAITIIVKTLHTINKEIRLNTKVSNWGYELGFYWGINLM